MLKRILCGLFALVVTTTGVLACNVQMGRPDSCHQQWLDNARAGMYGQNPGNSWMPPQLNGPVRGPRAIAPVYRQPIYGSALRQTAYGSMQGMRSVKTVTRNAPMSPRQHAASQGPSIGAPTGTQNCLATHAPGDIYQCASSTGMCICR